MATVEGRMGISYRQLDHWTRKGYLHPMGETGPGKKREWSLGEVRIGRMMSRLIAMGFTPRAAAQYARQNIEDDREMRLVLIGGRITANALFADRLRSEISRLNRQPQAESPDSKAS